MKILAIDIGGTFIKYARMTGEAEILSRGKLPTPQSGRGALIDVLSALYAEEPTDGIAISMPGIIDPEQGLVLMGGALHYNDGFYLRRALFERCPVPISIENDANCAALAEAADGSLWDVPNGMVLIFGTMIGGALIRDHQLYRGSHFSAGEISYLITDRSGVPTADGIWGNRCSVPQLCRTYERARGLPEGSADGEAVFAAVNAGEPEAVECLRAYAAEVAVQIFNLQNLYDPDRFAIGGGISTAPAFIEAIRAHLKRLYEVCPYSVRRAEVAACRFNNDANLYGAVRCFLALRERDAGDAREFGDAACREAGR
ncbi:MAG: ROK family protein [Oscillospiraceae bacterium]|nr:ROK family protein [Oscillospiraceae bacterium]